MVKLIITPNFEYENYDTKIQVQKLNDNDKYRKMLPKLVKGDNAVCNGTGMKFGKHTSPFYSYPDYGEYRNFKKILKNSWTYKTFDVIKKCN